MKNNFFAEGFIAERIFNQPLLISEQKASIIARVLERRMGINVPVQQAYDDDDYGSPRKRESFSKVDRIGIVSVIGTLVHRGGSMEAASGMTSYQSLKTSLIDAANDPGVDVIVLDVDSCGGEVDGNFDLAKMIRKINDEYKPVVAIANGAAYSGGYSLACAAGQFFMIETGGVGSIGVIVQHVDYSAANEVMGIKVTNVVAGKRKAELSPDFPLSDSARADLQEKVNRTYELFTGLVSEMRGISIDAVKSTEAALLDATTAVKLGLVDGVIAFDDLIGALIETPMTQKETLQDFSQRMKMSFLKKKQNVKVDETKPEDVPVDAPASEEKPEEEVADPEKDEDKKEETAVDPVERAAEISDICQSAGMPELASAYIRGAQSVEDVKKSVDAKVEIHNLCKLAGKPEQAKEFIAKGQTPQEVSKTLLANMQVEQEQKTVAPTPSPAQVKEDMKKSEMNSVDALNKDVERRIAAANKKAGK